MVAIPDYQTYVEGRGGRKKKKKGERRIMNGRRILRGAPKLSLTAFVGKGRFSAEGGGGKRRKIKAPGHSDAIAPSDDVIE